jgi:hypothetical protein
MGSERKVKGHIRVSKAKGGEIEERKKPEADYRDMVERQREVDLAASIIWMKKDERNVLSDGSEAEDGQRSMCDSVACPKRER